MQLLMVLFSTAGPLLFDNQVECVMVNQLSFFVKTCYLKLPD
jgi:hypothetical protein